MELPEDSCSLQKFLDQKQYSKNGVLRYEWIFGRHFLSTGGISKTKNFVATLDLKPGQKVLDVGSGLGGHAFYMAENFGVEVLGVDLSVNMNTLAVQNLKQDKKFLESKIQFVVCDITKENFSPNTFDVIYSRDALLHIKDKDELLRHFYVWLKPGGKLFFTDYVKGNDNPSEEFLDYIKDRGYYLLNTLQYKEILTTAGFSDVCVTDITADFLDALENEYYKLTTEAESFLKNFNKEDYKHLADGWTAKIKRGKDGDQGWVSAYGRKPVTQK